VIRVLILSRFKGSVHKSKGSFAFCEREFRDETENGFQEKLKASQLIQLGFYSKYKPSDVRPKRIVMNTEKGRYHSVTKVRGAWEHYCRILQNTTMDQSEVLSIWSG